MLEAPTHDAGHSSALLSVLGPPVVKLHSLTHAELLSIPICSRTAVQGQRIEQVTVYPSDYGLAQMAEEAKLGPRAILAPSAARAAADADAGLSDSDADEPDLASEGDSDLEDEEPARAADGAGKAGARNTRADRGDDDEDDGAEVDQRRLCMYERSKLRYFYAVVDCDGIATASHLYRECDGIEFELSANRCACIQTRWPLLALNIWAEKNDGA